MGEGLAEVVFVYAGPSTLFCRFGYNFKDQNLRKSKFKKECDIKNRNLKILKFKRLKFKKMKILKLRNSKDIKAWIIFLFITTYCTVSRMEMWKTLLECVSSEYYSSTDLILKWYSSTHEYLVPKRVSGTQKSTDFTQSSYFSSGCSVFTIIDKKL